MMPQGTIEDLRKVTALSDLPEEHLQWILARADYMEFEDGDLMIRTGEPVEFMMLMFEGKSAFYMDMNGKMVYYFSFENNSQTGGAGGLLPYSRMKASPGNAYAVGKVKGFRLDKKYFQELEQLNPDLIQRLIGYMTERARHFATQKLQHEKVNALGQLAAGIAHELNNPAAAINRIAAELVKRLMQNYDLTEKLLDSHINPQFVRSVREIMENKKATALQKPKLSAMQRIEREDEITDWLKKNNFIENRQAAETFIESDFSIDDLESVRSKVGDSSFISVLQWLENRLSAQRILKDLDDASCRISNLVGAIKSHVHMDRTSDMQPTNIHRDLENTLTLLGYKMRDKNITLKKNYCDNLDNVHAYIGELNQVWTNLIDNAIYAVEKNGEINIETACNSKEVTVRIIDNGAGIPKEIMSRIFDPFFTTKKVGEGTGIGLDLVMRIVKRHNGEIKVNSASSRTEFTITIPFSQKEQRNIA